MASAKHRKEDRRLSRHARFLTDSIDYSKGSSDYLDTMDPDEVFNEFNKILGPNFSLISGRRPDQTHNSGNGGGDASIGRRRRQELAGPALKIRPPFRLGKSSKKGDKGVLGNQTLPSYGKVTRNNHGTLFIPKEMVYIKRDSESWPGVAEEECVLVTNIEERVPSDKDAEDDNSTHALRCLRVSHNGHRFGVTNHSMDIGSRSHEIVNLNTEDLGVIPLRLLPAVERHDIEKRLISRGEQYCRICQHPLILMQYEGPVIPLDRGGDWTWRTSQRVVVDGMAERKTRGAHVNNITIPSHRGQSLKAFLDTEDHSMPDGGNPSSSQGGDLVSVDALPGAKGKPKSLKNATTREDHEWTDIDYLTCPPTVAAFLLDEKVWANVHVEHLKDIVWPENPFDSLELEIGKKILIQTLTHRFKTKDISEGSHQDIRGGRGGNLILLLSGPPGVGKTLTAEVVAEEAHLPLYSLSAGELSIDPSALKKQLGDIFILGRRWGAIILIDEADMFMTKRQPSTPDQNAAVTAFLRLLHTYDGLIFLTSTSEDIDTAFYDRIHATIKYTELDETQRSYIWRRQLQRAVGSSEETYRLLGKVETNGRDIRNIVRTAEQLALGLSTELTMKHVVAAMRNFGGSDDNVGSICEKLEVLEEKAGGHRGLACDDDVELQH